jgi:hypothetical protein
LNEEEKKKIKYKVQKNMQEFFETSTDNKKRKNKIQKIKEKINNSEFFHEMKQKFSDAPTEIAPRLSNLVINFINFILGKKTTRIG